MTKYIQATINFSNEFLESSLLIKNEYVVNIVANNYYIQSLDFYLLLKRLKKHLQD